jgi:hypothetical protein
MKKEVEQPAPAPVPASAPGASAPGTPAPAPGLVRWSGFASPYEEYEGHAVLVQLSKEYVGITYPNKPLTDADGEMLRARIVTGMLTVKEGMLEIRSWDALRPDCQVSLMFPQSLVEFISRVDEV